MHGSIHSAAILALTASTLAHAQYGTTDPAEAAKVHLRTAVTVQRDGSHLPLLFSLRQLQDPSLQPLFERIVDHDDWQVQVHAVLGLSEINPARRVEPQLLLRIKPAAQEAVIASAIDLDLLGPEQMTRILALQGIGDLPRLMLHAELISLQYETDLADVRTLAEHDHLRVSGLASLLLAQRGETTALAAFRSRFEKAGPRLQQGAMPWLLDAIRQYRLASAGDWLRSLYNDTTISDREKQMLVLTALTIDPARNLDLWKSYLGRSPSYAQRVRAGFMLLSAGEDAPAHAYNELLSGASGEELLVKLAAAGRARVSGENLANALIDLLDMEHPRTTEWVMTTLRSVDEHQAERVYRHLLDQLQIESPRIRAGQAERTGLAVTAAAKLFETDPELVVARLLDPTTDASLQQALLLGMFESHSPRAGQAAAELQVVGVGREASLRLLLIAKHADSLTAEQRRQLGLIAGGGGRVSDVLRAQAAWLYLKHTGQIGAALDFIFAD